MAGSAESGVVLRLALYSLALLTIFSKQERGDVGVRGDDEDVVEAHGNSSSLFQRKVLEGRGAMLSHPVERKVVQGVGVAFGGCEDEGPSDALDHNGIVGPTHRESAWHAEEAVLHMESPSHGSFRSCYCLDTEVSFEARWERDFMEPVAKIEVERIPFIVDREVVDNLAKHVE